MNTRFIIWPAVLLSVLVLWGAGQGSNAQDRLTVQTESGLWIEGTSTLNAFSCRSQVVEGVGILERRASTYTRTAASPAAPPPQAEVSVRVETFDCGKQRMNQDFFEALKADVYPVIRFTLERADVLATPASEAGLYRLRLTGWLTIAGAERSIETTVHGKRLHDGRYQVWGSQALSMSDFGIEPPTALLGLVRAHDRILVRFDLVAASTTTSTQSTPSTQ